MSGEAERAAAIRAENEAMQATEVAEHRADCPSYRRGHACTVCGHAACGWCPECHPEVPEW